MALELEDIKGRRESKGPKDTTRRQILGYLKQHGRATVEEIATAIGITSMGVRRHLLALENADLVGMELERRPMGRPTHIYQLTASAEALFPQTYHQLALQILDSIVELEGEHQLAQLFECRKQKLLAAYADRLQGKGLQARVAAVAQIMTENGYMAEWKEMEGGYAIVEHNCAISRVAQCYAQACDCELQFINELLGPDVEVTRKSHIASGDICCAYRVREKPSIKIRRRKTRG